MTKSDLRLEKYFTKARYFDTRGELDAAIKFYRKILVISPENWAARYYLSLAEIGKRDFSMAAKNLKFCLQLSKDDSGVLINLAFCLNQLGRSNEAIEILSDYLKKNPDHPEILNNLGNAYFLSGRFEEAQLNFERAYSMEKIPIYLVNLSESFRGQKKLDEAIATLEECLRVDDTNYTAHNNLACCYMDKGKLDDASHNANKALQIDPFRSEAWNTKGNILVEIGDYTEAESNYNKAIQIDPSWAEPAYNLGLLQLRLKKFRLGFSNYLYRWKVDKFCRLDLIKGQRINQNFSSSKNCLVIGEQGLGDQIFFSRFLPLFFKADQTINFLTDDRLHPVFARAFKKLRINFLKPSENLTDFDEVIGRGGYDCKISIGDLGCFLAETDFYDKKIAEPWLIPDQKRLTEIKASGQFNTEKIKCGISWKSPNAHAGSYKGVKLSAFDPLFFDSGIQFISLQYGDVQAEINELKNRIPGLDFANSSVDNFSDIEGVLATISACDFIVTISNVTAHLAGALGKTTLLLAPYSRGRLWYWHVGDSVSHWYPTIRIFEQSKDGSWESAVSHLTQEIKKLQLDLVDP